MLVHFWETRDTASGVRVPIVGRIRFRATLARVLVGTPDEEVLPAAFSVAMDADGKASVMLPATGLSWAWEVSLYGAGAGWGPIYVLVPEGDECDWPDLVRVDPATLDPAAAPEAAWWAAIEGITDDIGVAVADYLDANPPSVGGLDSLTDVDTTGQAEGDVLTLGPLGVWGPAVIPAPDLSGYALTTHDHDGDYDPAGTAASLVAGLTIPDSPDDIGAQPAGDYTLTTDPRLSDARTPLAHTHTVADLTDYVPGGGAGGVVVADDTPAAPAEGESASYFVTSAVVWPAGLVWSTDPDGGVAPTITGTALVSMFTVGGSTRAILGATFPALPDTVAPVAGTLASSSITETGFTLTVTGASDVGGLHAQPYSFDTGTGTFGAWQTPATLAVTGKAAGTAYTARHKVRDAAGNETTGASIVVNTVAADTTAPVWTATLTPGTPTETSVVVAASALATDNVGVTGYEVSYDNGSTWAAIVPSGLNFTLAGTAGTTYATSKLRAKDAAGNTSTPVLSVPSYTMAASSDVTAPTVGTMAASAITSSGFTLTVSGASDETALHATPYAFTTDGGTNWTAYQASAIYVATGKTAETGYSCNWRVRDAAGNVSTGTAQTVTTVAATTWVDTFGDQTGELPTGWTARWNQTYVTSAVESSGQFTITASGETNGKCGFSFDTPGDLTPGTINVLAKIRSNLNAESKSYIGIIVGGSGAVGADNAFHSRLAGVSQLLTATYVNGSTSNPVFHTPANIGYTWTANTWTWMRVECTATTVKAKLWADGSSEPGTWAITRTLTVPVGWVGLCGLSPSVNDCAYFAVSTSGSAPGE